MTPEEQREQLLKRILPALAITIIYFVFVSGFFSDKMKKAEEQYQNLVGTTGSTNPMQSILTQQGQLQGQVTKLRQEVKKLQQQLDEFAGFLTSGNTSNTATALLSKILASHNIKVHEEERASFPEKNLPLALNDVWQALKPVEESTDKKPQQKNTKENEEETEFIYVQHLWLKGSYNDVYQALNAIATGELKAIPVSLTMQMPEEGENDNSGELNWELILWM